MCECNKKKSSEELILFLIENGIKDSIGSFSQTMNTYNPECDSWTKENEIRLNSKLEGLQEALSVVKCVKKIMKEKGVV